MRRIFSERSFVGLAITLLGVNWLLNSAGIWNLGTGELLLRFWPVLFIYLGLRVIVAAAVDGGRDGPTPSGITLAFNLALTLVFGILLGNLNGWWHVDLSPVWRLLLPAALLAVGLAVLLSGLRRPGARTSWAVLSGSEEVRTTWEDLSIISILGGAVVDLSRAGLPDGDVQIDAFSLMGGGELIVPPGVKVICESTALFGGVKVLGRGGGGLVDQRVIEAGDGPVVRVRTLSVMGGFDVKPGGPGSP